jgi:hypothetical protein
VILFQPAHVWCPYEELVTLPFGNASPMPWLHMSQSVLLDRICMSLLGLLPVTGHPNCLTFLPACLPGDLPRFCLASITHTQTLKQCPSGTRKKCPSAHHHCLPGARSHPAAWGGQKLVSGGALHIGRPAVTRLTGVGVKPVVVAAPTLVGQQLTGR